MYKILKKTNRTHNYKQYISGQGLQQPASDYCDGEPQMDMRDVNMDRLAGFERGCGVLSWPLASPWRNVDSDYV